MGSKKTTKQNASSQTQQTNAPPSWTQPGLSQLGGDVMQAYNKVSGLNSAPYTGDFVAAPNTALVNELLQNLMDSKSMAGSVSGQFGGYADRLAGMDAPEMSGMDDLLALMPTTAQLQGVFNNPAAPDFQSMKPTMAAAPTFRGFAPQDFQADNGGARLEGALTAATQPFIRELMQTILPGITSSAIEAGAYSGDRAMSVLPGQAIADTATRANEVTQGLAYQGFQSEEQRRLAAWQAMQEMGLAAAGQENEFNTNIWSGTNDFNTTLFDILAGAESAKFATQQGAATAQGGQLMDALTGMYGTNASAMSNFNRDALAGQESERANLGAAGNMLMSMLQTGTAKADLTQEMINAVLGQEQATIDNALARDNYDLTQPFRGMDIATQLLQQLSGNWGTQSGTTNSQSKTVEQTSGLGSVVQGLAGLALGGASLFGGGGALGGLGGLLGSASAAKASPISAALFGGGARAGMSG